MLRKQRGDKRNTAEPAPIPDPTHNNASSRGRWNPTVDHYQPNQHLLSTGFLQGLSPKESKQRFVEGCYV